MVDLEGVKILVVDDEPDIVEMLAYNLEKEKAKVFKAYNGFEATTVANVQRPDVVLLDMMLPDMDGIEVCERIRKNPELENVIIVFLSARGEDYSQVAAYKAGADDYMVKPIRLKILIHKLSVLLERFKKQELQTDSDIRIDKIRFSVIHGQDELIIPKKEFELLSLLLSSPERVFRRDEILRDVWGDAVIGDRTIDVHVRKLRERFGDKVIQTIKGVGYKFAG
jgi:two-component system alkaline phosphatase synthesis response regulator PhoP